eukprot:6208490-Pleurochrysis_carterae.AAC.1
MGESGVSACFGGEREFDFVTRREEPPLEQSPIGGREDKRTLARYHARRAHARHVVAVVRKQQRASLHLRVSVGESG